ncbi:unnamed protein product [Lampetra fluviatilis]
MAPSATWWSSAICHVVEDLCTPSASAECAGHTERAVWLAACAGHTERAERPPASAGHTERRGARGGGGAGPGEDQREPEQHRLKGECPCEVGSDQGEKERAHEQHDLGVTERRANSWRSCALSDDGIIAQHDGERRAN